MREEPVACRMEAASWAQGTGAIGGLREASYVRGMRTGGWCPHAVRALARFPQVCREHSSPLKRLPHKAFPTRRLTVRRPVAVALAAMSGVEGVRVEKPRRGPAWMAGRLRRGRSRVEDPRPNARVRSGVSHKTPSRAAAPPFPKNDGGL